MLEHQGGLIIDSEFGDKPFGRGVMKTAKWWRNLLVRIDELVEQAEKVGFKKGKEEAKLDAAVDKLPYIGDKPDITEGAEKSLTDMIADYFKTAYMSTDQSKIAGAIRNIAIGYADKILADYMGLTEEDHKEIGEKIAALLEGQSTQVRFVTDKPAFIDHAKTQAPQDDYNIMRNKILAETSCRHGEYCKHYELDKKI